MFQLNSKIVAVIAVLGCILLLSLSIYYYKGSHDSTATVSPVAGKLNSISPTSSPTLQDVIETQPSFQPDNLPDDSYVAPPKQDEEITQSEVQDDVLKESVKSEDSIAKAWFDLRQKSATPDLVEPFIEQLKHYMESGRLPQIIESYPLVLSDYEEYGFSSMRLDTLEGYLNLVTVVLPNIEGVHNRVVVFSQLVNNSSINVSVFKGLSTIATERGISVSSHGYTYLLAGDCLDKGVNTDSNLSGIYGLTVSGNMILLTDISNLTDKVPAEQVSSDNSEVLYRSSPSRGIFFYSELVSEGVASDTLNLVVETTEDSTMYEIKYKDGVASLVPSTTSTKEE